MAAGCNFGPRDSWSRRGHDGSMVPAILVRETLGAVEATVAPWFLGAILVGEIHGATEDMVAP